MKFVIFLTVIELVKPLNFLAESAPFKESDERLYPEEKNYLGIPSDKRLKLSRFESGSDAIVFKGPTNSQRTDTAIKFPTDDDEIDLSGSFTPTSSTERPSMLAQIFEAYANCYVYSSNGTAASGAANTGLIRYPNGTQAIYSKCEVVQIIM